MITMIDIDGLLINLEQVTVVDMRYPRQITIWTQDGKERRFTNNPSLQFHCALITTVQLDALRKFLKKTPTPLDECAVDILTPDPAYL